MSEIAFQKALATLVRFPNQSVEKSMAGFLSELTDKERFRLETVATDPLVQKFGKKMQYVRHREAMSILRFSKQVIPHSLLDDLYFSHFEPNRKTTDPLWLGVEFIETVLSNPSLEKKIADRAPAWAMDCLKYEVSKAYVSRQVPKDADSSLPLGSRLRYREFRIINLNYDIPNFETKWVTDGVLPTQPEYRWMTLLFLPAHESPFYRMYEIDRDVENFLTTQRQNPNEWIQPLPPYYGDMQDVGLVQ